MNRAEQAVDNLVTVLEVLEETSEDATYTVDALLHAGAAKLYKLKLPSSQVEMILKIVTEIALRGPAS